YSAPYVGWSHGPASPGATGIRRSLLNPCPAVPPPPSSPIHASDAADGVGRVAEGTSWNAARWQEITDSLRCNLRPSGSLLVSRLLVHGQAHSPRQACKQGAVRLGGAAQLAAPGRLALALADAWGGGRTDIANLPIAGGAANLSEYSSSLPKRQLVSCRLVELTGKSLLLLAEKLRT